MIQFRKQIASVAEYQQGTLPENAVRLDTPGENTLLRAMPLGMTAFVVMGIAMFCKTFLSRSMVVHPAGILIGCALNYALLPVHELLHAVVYPKDACVTLGRLQGKPTWVALASYPLKRARFLLMCLLPFILGIVPLTGFFLLPDGYKMCSGICYGAACMGLYAPCADVYNVFRILKHSEPKDKIMFYLDGLYRIPGKGGEPFGTRKGTPLP